MRTLILAGGFGVRLKEVIHGRPKVMAPVGDKPFLEHLLLRLKKKGLTDFVLAVGYLADYIKDYFGDGRKWKVDIVYSEDNRPLGTAGTMKHAGFLFKSTFLAVNGDTYADFSPTDLLQHHDSHHAHLTMVVTKHHHGRGGFVALDRDDRVVGFQSDDAGSNGWSSAGAYMIDPMVLSKIERGQRASLESNIFPKLIAEKTLFGFRVKTDYIDIGTPEYYRKAKVLLLEG